MALASRGLRDLGGGLEPLEAGELAQVRAQAGRVHRRALLATIAFVVASLLVP